MQIFLVVQEANFAMVSRDVISNPKLSYRAKGLYAYLVMRGAIKDWHLNLEDIIAHGIEGKKAIYTALKELKNANLYAIGSIKDRDTGRFKGSAWYVFHKPYTPKDLAEIMNEAQRMLEADTALPLFGNAGLRESR
jgi:hypothetical protein